MDEAAWQGIQETKDFYINFPFDTSYAKPARQTNVKLLFDEGYIYVGTVCYQKKSEIVISSLKRDFEGGTSDVFSVNFDTFNDKLNGFQFAVNPYGVQREGLIQEGGNVSNCWDNKWYSQVKIYDDF